MEQAVEHTEQVTKITEELLSRLEIAGTVSVDIDETGAYRVHIATEETGLLIGFHGKTLESFQIILGIMISKSVGEWVHVYVNVNDYREKREEALMHMAQRAADRVLETGRSVELARLSPSERRVIHLTLSGDERVMTESIGEGEDRRLVVRLRV
ncbi:KH domain-containing protein [Candidatus Gottesmanbacteria bacterium]|nr:KH domain-containing protein [Candidatus Gottesmanbacteria bacterium]